MCCAEAAAAAATACVAPHASFLITRETEIKQLQGWKGTVENLTEKFVELLSSRDKQAAAAAASAAAAAASSGANGDGEGSLPREGSEVRSSSPP